MRITFAGSHRTGKTTLIEAVADRARGYAVIDEPYRLLEDDGYEQADPPSADDYLRQLRCSLDAIAEAPADALIDRSPLDFVAYLRAIGEPFEIDDWRVDLRDAFGRLDHVVFVPIEQPDRVAVADHEDRVLRRAVDDALRDLLVDDLYGLAGDVVEVTGDLDARVRTVLDRLSPRPGTSRRSAART